MGYCLRTLPQFRLTSSRQEYISHKEKSQHKLADYSTGVSSAGSIRCLGSAG